MGGGGLIIKPYNYMYVKIQFYFFGALISVLFSSSTWLYIASCSTGLVQVSQ